MENKKRIVDLPGVFLVDNEGVLDYKIVTVTEKDEDKIFLCAVGKMWSNHIVDTVLFKVTDHGNGIKIGRKYLERLTNGNEGGMDYDDAEYLRILLNYRNSVGHMPSKYFLVEETSKTI